MLPLGNKVRRGRIARPFGLLPSPHFVRYVRKSSVFFIPVFWSRWTATQYRTTCSSELEKFILPNPVVRAHIRAEDFFAYLLELHFEIDDVRTRWQ